MVEDDSISGQPYPPKGRGLVVLVLAFLGLTAGLCAVLALVVTAGQAWVEHAQAQWPEATARVQRCGVDIYTHNPDTYWIDCSISYVVRGKDIISHVHSKGTPAPQRLVWQYPDPAGQLGRLQEWVDEHPEGMPIVMHYDPANPKKAVLVITDMPLGGPQAAYSLKLLGFCVVSCVVLLTIARIARPRVTAANGPG